MNEPIVSWPFSVRFAHWLGAVLVLAAMGLGTYMVLLVTNPAERFELTQTHKSIGIVILALTVARLCFRIFMRAPKPEPAARPILLAAKASHAGLYLLLLLMPLSGYLMASTTPIRVPTLLFGLLELPYPLAPNLGTYRLAHAAHIGLAVLLAFLIGLHFAAAIVHAVLWRDRTLVRMFRGSVSLTGTNRESNVASTTPNVRAAPCAARCPSGASEMVVLSTEAPEGHAAMRWEMLLLP